MIARPEPYLGPMKVFCTMALVVVGGLASSEMVLAGEASRGGRPALGNGCFERSDVNGDGQVTVAEARADALSMFDSFDADRDGSLSRTEARSGARRWRQRRLEVLFEMRDVDGDAALEASEMGVAARRFTRWDRNGDQRLTRTELKRAWGSRRGGEWGEVALAGRVLRWDFDRDGWVARAEAARAAVERFARKDRNGDGVLTRAEARLDGPGAPRR